jgi:hypothetical protein
MRFLLIAIGALFFASLSDDTEAQSNAPFCVVSQTGTTCRYYTPDECRRFAAMENGACVVNANRDSGSSGGGVWDQFDRGVAIGERMAPPPDSAPARQPTEAEIFATQRRIADATWQRVCLGVRNSQYDRLYENAPSDPDEYVAAMDAIEARYNDCAGSGQSK